MMVNSIVLREFIAKLGVARGLIRHDVRLARDILLDDRKDVLFRGRVYMERARSPVALNERQNRVRIMNPAGTRLNARLAANESLVNLND